MECYSHKSLEVQECGDTRIIVQCQSKTSNKSTVGVIGNGQGDNFY